MTSRAEGTAQPNNFSIPPSRQEEFSAAPGLSGVTPNDHQQPGLRRPAAPAEKPLPSDGRPFVVSHAEGRVEGVG